MTYDELQESIEETREAVGLLAARFATQRGPNTAPSLTTNGPA